MKSEIRKDDQEKIQYINQNDSKAQFKLVSNL